ncbi:hypothetical protein ACHAXT_012218 [Thalassiosira profunda]
MAATPSVRLAGASVRVVDHDGLTIDEVVGNVSTQTDLISVAIVTNTKPASEPWLTLHYDEWMHVTEGHIELHQETSDGSRTILKVEAGQTAFIPKGSRFQPVFPVAAKYIPVCLPAFAPERCLREEGTELSDVSKKLHELHGGAKDVDKPAAKTLSAEEVNAQFDDVRTIYHMCPTSQFDAARSSKSAYYPPTFHQDGKFTHATAIPANLIGTANHFYTATEGDWICLQLDRTALQNLGIVTIFESAKPVGDIDTDEGWKDAVFPHIFGGLPLHVDGVLTGTYQMKRGEDGTFLSIEGLVG